MDPHSFLTADLQDRAVLEQGVDVTARDGRGSTAADTAMANGNIAIAERLRGLEASNGD